MLFWCAVWGAVAGAVFCVLFELGDDGPEERSAYYDDHLDD